MALSLVGPALIFTYSTWENRRALDDQANVRIERSLQSFTSVVETPVVENQWVHMIHGALRVYDLPDLAASLGDKLELIDPVDASGKVIKLNEK